jgi:hypothetical protein
MSKCEERQQHTVKQSCNVGTDGTGLTGSCFWNSRGSGSHVSGDIPSQYLQTLGFIPAVAGAASNSSAQQMQIRGFTIKCELLFKALYPINRATATYLTKIFTAHW